MTNINNDAPVNMAKLFTDLKLQWQTPSPHTCKEFSSLSHRLTQLMRELQNNSSLMFLDKQFYPEWRVLDRSYVDMKLEARHIFSLKQLSFEEFRSGFYFCNHLIQLMEDVYLDLDLESYAEHPDNRGWINLFRHWSWSSMFQVCWTISACTFGIRFQHFCEYHLNLKLGQVAARFVDTALLKHSTFNAFELLQIQNILQACSKHKSQLRIYSLELNVTTQLLEDERDDSLFPVFNFGYAVIKENRQKSQPDSVIMFRVQDHLRTLGLGQAALLELVSEISKSDQSTVLEIDSVYTSRFNLAYGKSSQSSFNSTVDPDFLSHSLFKEIDRLSVTRFTRMLDAANINFQSHRQLKP